MRVSCQCAVMAVVVQSVKQDLGKWSFVCFNLRLQGKFKCSHIS